MWDFVEPSIPVDQEAGDELIDFDNLSLLVATEFIYNLVTEPTIPYGNGSVAYLHKMESIRPAYRDLAKSSVASRIERESKANDSVDESLSDLSNRSYRRILEETIEDRGFKQRFNLLWGDSQPVPQTDMWKHEPWFGYFTDVEYPWIYHLDLGWLYSSGTSSMHVWLYSSLLAGSGSIGMSS